MSHIVARVPGAPLHLRPAAELAERVLLPGDPHRALHVAQALLEKPLMFNHHRGLWGYTGAARDGAPLTVQSTGHGRAERRDRGRGADRARRPDPGPDRDLRRARRATSRWATLVPVEASLAADGASRALGADGRVEADPALARALAARERARAGHGRLDRPLLRRARGAAGGVGRRRAPRSWRWRPPRCCRSPPRHGVRAGCLLAVTDRADRRARARARSSRSRRWASRWARRPGRAGAAGARPAGASETRQALLRPRRQLVARGDGLADRRQVARDLVEARLEPLRELGDVVAAGPRARLAASRSSSRSTASSMPSSRCETERSRRVSRSMSAADGIPRAPIAASWACTAFSRASNARASAAFTTGLPTSSSASLPSASSPCRERRSLRPSSFARPRAEGTRSALAAAGSRLCGRGLRRPFGASGGTLRAGRAQVGRPLGRLLPSGGGMGTPKEPPRMARNGSPLRTSFTGDSVPPVAGSSGSLRAGSGPLRGPEGGQ